ncbi:MAG: glycosyltransferase family 29 protein [Methylobacter sp.]|uniref:glycosyltransferase family 29 protein n=1 Tax=Methylobacter sp. TaxID=2051955 RepID=UPI002732185D|nr:glycosyltransferase family 29 protein [Methylobacter sp.]MDP1666515.1 glycosyltransferase family 29 protein [Methylobacter sp.]
MIIAIVGNATVETDLSDEINSADLVVRFNVATKNNFNINTGVKTDVLCVCNSSAPGRAYAKYRRLATLPFINEVNEIWFPRPTSNPARQVWFKPWSRQTFRQTDYSKFIVSRNGLKNKKIVYFGDDLFHDCCHMLDIAKDCSLYGPSSGFLALQYVLQQFDLTEHQLLMIGFTFSGSETHRWQKEKEEVLKLQAQGLLRLL